MLYRLRGLAAVFAATIALALGGCAQFQSGHADTVAEHRLVIHIDDKDPAKMNLALNNLANVYEYYRAKGEPVRVEVVAYGPGLTIFRADKSPVKARLETLKLAYDNLTYSACGNTMRAVEKAEHKPVTLVPDVQVVPAGVVRILELEEQGWSYVRP